MSLLDLDGDGAFEQTQAGDPTFLVSYDDNGFATLDAQVCDDLMRSDENRNSERG